MAKNPPKGPGRRGAVKDRLQFYNLPTTRWYKHEEGIGKIIDTQANNKPFKGIRKERTLGAHHDGR